MEDSVWSNAVTFTINSALCQNTVTYIYVRPFKTQMLELGIVLFCLFTCFNKYYIENSEIMEAINTFILPAKLHNTRGMYCPVCTAHVG